MIVVIAASLALIVVLGLAAQWLGGVRRVAGPSPALSAQDEDLVRPPLLQGPIAGRVPFEP